MLEKINTGLTIPEEEMVDKSFDVKEEDFKTSSHTGRNLSKWRCVQVARTPQGVALRDSKDKTKKTLFFTNEEWVAFTKGVKGNEFEV